MNAGMVEASESPYEAMVREIDLMQEMLRALRGALERKHVALFWTSVNTLDKQANAVQNSASRWFESTQKETVMNDATHTTLLTCMAVDGGPEGCCGCFNGRQNGESIEFFCNECGRVVFNAVACKKEDADA